MFRKKLLFLCSVVLVSCIVGSVSGAIVWTSAAADQDWNNGGNWAGGVVPAAGDVALLVPFPVIEFRDFS